MVVDILPETLILRLVLDSIWALQRSRTNEGSRIKSLELYSALYRGGLHMLGQMRAL